MFKVILTPFIALTIFITSVSNIETNMLDPKPHIVSNYKKHLETVTPEIQRLHVSVHYRNLIINIVDSGYEVAKEFCEYEDVTPEDCQQAIDYIENHNKEIIQYILDTKTTL